MIRDEGGMVVLVTASSQEEARSIAEAIVSERLAACANIIGEVRSIYRWEGEVRDEPEVLMIIKSRAEHFGALEARIRELHSYSVPEIIALKISDGSAPYMDWLFRETRST